MAHSSSVLQGLVLKRSNIGEKDRLVTIISQDEGKRSYVVKGARAPKSSRLGVFEPGNIVRFQRLQRDQWPLVTQATIISDSSQARTSLTKIRQLSLILEMFDRLFVEEEIDTSLYEHVLSIRDSVTSSKKTNTSIRSQLHILLELIGFGSQTNSDKSVTELVESITERPLRSHEYLLVTRKR